MPRSKLSFLRRWDLYYQIPAESRDLFDWIWLWFGLE